jgi:hypothetical protein
MRAIILFGLLFLFFSCNKTENNNQYSNNNNNNSCPSCLPKPGGLPPIPYDTSVLSGAFICANHIYISNLYGSVCAKFYNVAGSQKNGTPDVLFTNNSQGSGYGGLAFDGSYFLTLSVINDSTIYWRVSDGTTFSFSFTDTNYPPFINIESDTITNNSGVATLIDSFVNTDSIGVAINDSVHYYNTSSNTISLNLRSYGITADTSVGILISLIAYKHQYHEVNGFNYLFIKEYEQVSKSVWLK